MSSALSLPPKAVVHQEDAVIGMKTQKLSSRKSQPSEPPRAPEPKLAPEFTFKSDSVALSFAYDTLAQSLHIVMTDKISGDVVRKITYKHLPTDVHQVNKLRGLLLDRQA